MEADTVRVPKTKPKNSQELDALLQDDETVDDDYELSKEEILDSIERGFRDILAGNTRPAEEFLDELDNESAMPS